MKYLVVYYSRTGNIKTIGMTIGKALSSDIDEIIDKKKRAGIVNLIRAGRDGQAKKLTEIQSEKNPQDYDVIVLGWPAAELSSRAWPSDSRRRPRCGST